jgi:hypothetical protein
VLPRSTPLLWTIAFLAFAGLAAIAGRVPISEGDDAFYASVARALPSHGNFDVTRFYGPVFFRTVTLTFSWFGFSVASLRVTSLVGALLIIIAGLVMARLFGASRREQAWTCALLVLSPEVGWAATAGRMDSLAVGLELLALAALVRGLLTENGASGFGVLAGSALAAAALTTPRTFPFLFGLVTAVAYGLTASEGRRRAQASRLFLIAGITSLTLISIWIVIGAGGFSFWIRTMWAVASHQRDDVALLPGVRVLAFGWARAVTPVVAVAGALALASRRPSHDRRQFALVVTLVTAWTTFVVSATLFTLTFFYATYVIVPLLVVVLALAPRLPVSRHAAGVMGLALLLVFGTIRIGKHVRAAITWSARDPQPVAAFLKAHVPPGSIVIGPHYLYEFPAVQAGSRFRTANPVSWADWTLWIPEARGQGGSPVEEVTPKFLLWPTDESMVYGPPPIDDCAPGAALAVYEPPADDLPGLARLIATDDLRGYPRARLSRLGAACRTVDY